MCLVYSRLCSLLIREVFGEVCQQVTDDLQRCGMLSLNNIACKLPRGKVKDALAVLTKHNLIKFTQSDKRPPEYSFYPDQALLLLRYPKYLFLVKTLFGNDGEALIEEVLHAGQITLSNLLISAAVQLQDSSQDEAPVSIISLKEKFNILVNKKYLERCPFVGASSANKLAPQLRDDTTLLHAVPDVDIAAIQTAFLQRTELLPAQPDTGIYWKVVQERFSQDFRDKLIIQAAERRIDKSAAQLMQIFLELGALNSDPWITTYNPVTVNSVRDVLKRSNYHNLSHFLDQYIKVLEEDSAGFIMQSGSAAGGEYRVTIKLIIENLTWCLLENIVRERFGSRALRIFRLLRLHRYLEQEQIQHVAMIQAKEAKLLTYMLLEHNLIQLREVRKGGNQMQAKPFYMFYIDINYVARMVLLLCYKGVFNACTRRNHEENENKRLLDKQQRVDSIIQSGKEQGASQEQLSEIEELLTPPERAAIEKVTKTTDKLQQAELQVDQSIFILQLFLYYNEKKDDD